jgi:hypothetical protein
MRPFDVTHRDPHPLARSAAIRSMREQDPYTRSTARSMTIAQRLRAGLALSSAAWRLRSGRR